jgi:predicted metal-dependent hydrolase
MNGTPDSHASKTKETRPIRPRTPQLNFAGVRRYWCADSRVATHVWNGVNLLFPAGERFFVRSVRHYMNALPPELAADVKGFFGQEGRHAQAHERIFQLLREQGYDVDAVIRPYERIAFQYLERIAPAALRLSITAAAEHFTALMAEDALTVPELLDAVDPQCRGLFLWHAVEELEHKAVAFDVLAAVAPSYPLRVTGMAIGALMLGVFWAYTTTELMKQDGMTLMDAKRELDGFARAPGGSRGPNVLPKVGPRIFVRGIGKYLRRDFHPNNKDHSELIKRALVRLTGEGVVAATPS